MIFNDLQKPSNTVEEIPLLAWWERFSRGAGPIGGQAARSGAATPAAPGYLGPGPR
jgi:hypothetical protein